MAYIFKVTYLSNSGKLKVPDITASTDILAKIMCDKLQNFNSIMEEANNKETNNTDFYFVYHPISDFFGGNGIKRRHLFAQYIFIENDEERNFYIKQNKERIAKAHFLTQQDSISEENRTTQINENTKYVTLPIIHISVWDLFNDKDLENDFQKQGIIIPRYIKYLDSSIWNQYVPLKKENKQDDNSFNSRLCEAVKNIVHYTNGGFFQDDKIKAIANFNARLLINSHLESNMDKHDAYVSPFVFHSEMEMKTRTLEQIEDIKTKYKNGLQWRILLIDDKAKKIEGGEEAENDSNINICKVLDKLTKELELSIEWKCVKTLDEVRKCFTTQRYDIVLLDYLLGPKPNSNTIKDREYGYELLDWIKSESPKEKGTFNKFWIMFVSIFRNAVSGRLQEKGYTYNDANWYIARGACPITTPELFKYNLLSFMLLQLNVITNLSLGPTAQRKIQNERIITLLNLLEKIYGDLSKVRENAIAFFDALLKIRANYNILKKDAEYKNDIGKSELVTNLFPDIGNYDNAFWEHLKHLVYLTAFGTIRQWPDMWEEYMLIKGQIEGGELLKNIEDYIISLKQI